MSGQNQLSQRQVLLEIARKAKKKQDLLKELFPLQREVVTAKEMFTVLLCGRRSGKSHLLAYMIVFALIDAEANEHVWFAAMSAKKAKEIIWETLVKVAHNHRMVEDFGWDINHSTHEIRTRAGGIFKLLGVGEERNVDKVRGNKYRLFVCDEAATYDDLLGHLLNEGVIPALGESLHPKTGERIGRVVVAGTPTGILAGEFYEISTGLADAEDTPEKDKWHIRTWTMSENPHIPDPDEYMAMVRRKNGWMPDHPTFLQEYKARWVANNEILVVPEVHDTKPESAVTTEGVPHWVHYIGIDYGYNPDFCSAVVIAKRRGCAWARVVHVWKENKLDDIQFAERVKELVDRFRPLEVVGDTAGAGSRAIATFNERYSAATGVWIAPARKEAKKSRIAALNTALRRKLLFVDKVHETATDPATQKVTVVRSTEPLRHELSRLRWRDTTRQELDPRCDDHAFDALNYAFMTVHELLEEEDAAEVRGRASSDEEAERQMLEEMEAERNRLEDLREMEGDLW